MARRTRVSASFRDRPLTSYQLILVATGLLTVIGVVMVASASAIDSYSATGSMTSTLRKQVLWLALGIPAFWLALRLRPQTYRRLARPALLLALLALLAVMVPGIGVYALGARRWIDLGPLQLQPSEPAKLALALWGADLLVRKQRLLGSWRHLFLPLVPVGIVMGGLIVREPDLGTTLCVMLVLLGLLWTVGAPMRAFVMLLVGAMGMVVMLILVQPYRAARITSYLDPFRHASGTGMQAARGLQAVGSGGWFGVGLGQSRFKWGLLPEAHTDFIFAIIGEELGLAGALAVLTLFALLGYAGFRIASRTTDPFVRLVSAAVTVCLVGQALINIGYVTGLLPVTGIPLPLISFGGTSLIMTLFSLGMLASFARHEPDAVASLQVRAPSRTARLLLIPTPDIGYLRPARTRSRYVWDADRGRRVPAAEVTRPGSPRTRGELRSRESTRALQARPGARPAGGRQTAATHRGASPPVRAASRSGRTPEGVPLRPTGSESGRRR